MNFFRSCLLPLTILPFLFCSCSAFKSGYLGGEGSILLKQGQYEEARCTLEQSIRLYPSARAHADLAYAYFQLGDEKNCWLHLRKAYMLDRTNSKYVTYLDHYWKLFNNVRARPV